MAEIIQDRSIKFFFNKYKIAIGNSFRAVLNKKYFRKYNLLTSTYHNIYNIDKELGCFFFLILTLFISGKGGGLGSLASSQSVSFRQGSNVEFGGVGAPEPAYTLEETAPRKGRDFSNPMYEAVTRATAAGDPEPALRKSTPSIDTLTTIVTDETCT